MPDSEQLVLAVPAHNNQSLFSDHYLNEVLPSNAYWRALQDKAQPVMEQIVKVFQGFTPSKKERQTEDDLVVRVLRLLGHTFEVQPSLNTPEGTKTPDYAFYRDAEAVAANKGKVLDETLPQDGGIAVGDAKYWERPLDIAIKQKTGDALSNKNPSYQICFYMLHSGVTWGILTNGRQWRLYHKDTAHKLDHFYEVDLKELIESDDVGRFLYFYALFRREAFEDGALSLATILRESADYARNVGNTLKVQVYDALRHVAQGFLDYTPNGLKSDAGTLEAIYDNSLILLYRLIFVLYAEARELLPLRENQQYRDIYSLHAIKNTVAQDLAFGRTPLPGTALLWPRLRELFNTINAGNEPLKVATYNGGLFDPERHDFLTRNAVGDAHLQQAVDKLTRVNGEFVDYRDLAVRHMGTIYEGLLEYRLQPLSTPEKGWTLALVNDKGERKATGSYYTPDYIVKYIVEQTVGPVLERAVAGKETDAGKLAAVLEVNVLDPAMGSGHFLVETTEYIARFLVDLALTPEGKTPEEADLAFWKRRVVQSCIYGVDLNPLAVELAKLSLWLTTVAKDKPLSFLDHHLRAGNSLVGAQLRHLTLGVKRRKSNAVREVEKGEQNGQIRIFADSEFAQRVSRAVGFMEFIEASDASDVEQVRAQEKAYADLREELADRYARLLNVFTAHQLGMEIEGKHRAIMPTYLTSRKAFPVKALERVMDQADEIAKRERFFHWEIEFPEIYFDRFGRQLGDEGGFEAVVGNPPYVRQEQLAPYKTYFERHFPSVYHGVVDLYAYFFAQGVRQLQSGGLLAYISSSTFRWLDSGAPLRKHLAQDTIIVQLVDFGDQQVFDDAITYPAILVLEKTPPADESTLTLHTPAVFTAPTKDGTVVPVPEHKAPWVFVRKGLDRVVQGWEGSTPLTAFINHSVHRGVTTGCNAAFVIDGVVREALIRKDPASSGIIKSLVRGEDLHPWYQGDSGEWLIFTRRGIDVHAYPAVKEHLNLHHQRLEPKPIGWNDSIAWPGRKAGNYEWYEIQDTVEYYQVFERPRIHSTKVSLYPSYSISEGLGYAANTSYVIPLGDMDSGYYLLGLLNSQVSAFFCRSVFAPKANGYYEVQPGQLEQFPVPHCDKAVSKAIGLMARQITSLARERYALHCRVRHRIQTDLGTANEKLNQKLTAWWNLDFPQLRAELKKVFGSDIPVAERDEWEKWFSKQRAEHQRLTDEIIRLETELNERVYKLFDLTPDEIKLIEESTKYKYGQV